MKIHLLRLNGKSGKQYCLSFECEDFIDVEAMLRDCVLEGEVDGILQDTIVWEDMPEPQTVMQ